MTSAPLILPGASLYQILYFQKLEEDYKDSLSKSNWDSISQDTAHVNNKTSTDEAACNKFYDSCYVIDNFGSTGVVISLAKIVSGITLEFFTIHTSMCGVGAFMALEGFFQHAHSLYKMSQDRWHIYEENINDQRLKFIYYDNVKIQISG